jgi:hypothetical protein
VLVQLLLPVGGAAAGSVVIPMDPILVGLALHNQVAQVELDPLLNIIQITASNGLRLSLGSF